MSEQLPGLRCPSSSDCLEALALMYPSAEGEWAMISELRVGAGYGKGKDQRIDAWVIRCWGGNQRLAFEVKVSRSDLLRELRDPLKRRAGLRLSTQFYFVAPEGMVRPDELPLECGLIEVSWGARGWGWLPEGRRGALGEGWRARIVLDAPVRDTHPPTWNFVAALLRRSNRDRSSS